LSSENPTWTDPGLSTERSIINHLSHGTVLLEDAGFVSNNVSMTAAMLRDKEKKNIFPIY
jgi:hypothetical protein